MGGGLGRVIHHPEYYFNDGSVSFLTGNTLFRVHKTFFERESEVFRELFADAAEDDPPSGTDARPFTFDDVTGDDFAQLLWVWYDRDYSYHQQSKENWVTILRLATRWKFEKIKELALRELEALELPPAERISIYNEHSVDGERVISSFVELCKSPTVPTEADGHLLQMESLIKLLQAREEGQRKAVELGHNSPTSASLEDEALREILSKHLNKGLDPRSSGSSTGSGDQAPDMNLSERAHETTGVPTTMLKTPRVPDQKTKSAGETSTQMSSEAKGSRGKEQKNLLEQETGNQGKLTKATPDKEMEEKKADKEEKTNVQKVKQERETKGRGRG